MNSPSAEGYATLFAVIFGDNYTHGFSGRCLRFGYFHSNRSKTVMRHAILVLAIFTLTCSPALGANIWLSSNGNIGTGSTPPTTVGAIPTITHQPSAMQGTFYIWARPTATKTLENWSLKLVSSNPSVVTFNTAAIEAYNPCLGNCSGEDIVRWEFTDPTPSAPSIAVSKSLEGLNVFGVDRSGVGIGPASDGIPSPGPDQYDDPFYDPATNAWLLASVNYTLHGLLGQSSIHLQIGDIGMNHAGDINGSADTNVVFGLTTDPARNAHTQRNLSSATAEMLINVSNTPPGDFDGDNDADGRDFLVWQRGGSPAPFSSTDLAAWRNAYSGSVEALNSIPEPCTAVLLSLLALMMNTRPARIALGIRA